MAKNRGKPSAPAVRRNAPWQRVETVGECTLYLGDCVEVMAALEPESCHSVVTDPPYELGFMGKAWDKAGGVASTPATWQRALDCLKPGGHLVAFAGSRTYHRIACAIEDAGFEIRDQLMWIYGSGFPKSLDVAKSIDKSGGGMARQSRHAASRRSKGADASRIQASAEGRCRLR